jgi:hypothetical protein
VRPEFKAVQRNDGGSVKAGRLYAWVDVGERRTREDKKRGSVRIGDRQMRVEASAEEGGGCC